MNKQIQYYVLALILLATIALTYSNHFTNDFHFDDKHTIVENIHIRSLNNFSKFFTDGKTLTPLPSNQMYRPIVTLSFAFDYYLGGQLNPFYFHLSNFIWYVVQLFFLFFVFLKIFNLTIPHKWNTYIAFFSIGWYGLHTANAETINYVSARSDSYSTLFIIIGFVLYIFSPISRKYHLYLIALILAALTKPTGLMFAPLLCLYILLFEKKVPLTAIFSKKNRSALRSTLLLALPAFLVLHSADLARSF